jgi:predicted nucleotidyltransferase
MLPVIPIDQARIVDFCCKWKVREFSLFGSVLREDFRPESDVDVLIEFEPNIPWSLYDWIDMIDELKDIFGRDVDLVCKEGLRNPFRRKRILETRKVIYGEC